MKLLLVSDLAHTGFGRVGRALGEGLLKLGWDIRILGINWRGNAMEWASRISASGDKKANMIAAAEELGNDPLLEFVIPAASGGDSMGNALFAPAARGQVWPGWIPDRILVVADPRAMFYRLVHDQRVTEQIPTLNYVPIEGTGLPPSMAGLWTAAKPVAMSRFGQDQLQTLLNRPVPLVTHGVSPAFRPISVREPGSLRGGVPITDKEQAKAAFGLGGKTVILRTDRYIERKNYAAFFRVLEPVLAAHPEVEVIVHTVTGDPDGKGDIRELISRLPGAVNTGGYLDWSHPQIHLTGAHDSWRGMGDEDLRLLYCAADLYLSPTMAEGFGLCLVESMACGTPVIATDFSSVTEVVGDGGVLIPPDHLLTNPYGHEWALVDEAAMTAAVERFLGNRRMRRELSEKAVAHVAQYNWPTAVIAFDRLLEAA